MTPNVLRFSFSLFLFIDNQKLKKWYLKPPCLTLSIIRYGSRVKWNNPGKGVAPSYTPHCSNYWKGSPPVTLDIYKVHSIKESNFVKELAIGSIDFSCTFSSKWINLFTSQNTVSVSFFTECYTENFFYRRVSIFTLNRLFFRLGLAMANLSLVYL